jgi:hypothetical protein
MCYVLWSSGRRMIWYAEVVTALPDSAVVVGCCSLGQATLCFVTPHLQKMGFDHTSLAVLAAVLLNSSEIWRRFVGRVVPGISKDHSAVFIRVMRWNNSCMAWETSVVVRHSFLSYLTVHTYNRVTTNSVLNTEMFAASHEWFQSSWMWRRLVSRHQWVNSNLLPPS